MSSNIKGLSLLCTKYFFRFYEFFNNDGLGFMKYTYGTEDSNCPSPCEQAEVIIGKNFSGMILCHPVRAYQHFVFCLNIFYQISAQLITKKRQSDFTTLYLDIIQEVQVTEYYFPEFSSAKFFAEIGGSLGFWLGVGTMQLIKSFADVACMFRRSIDYD